MGWAFAFNCINKWSLCLPYAWFKQYLFRIKYMGIYTMSCETGSDIKHKAFVKVISCESK